MMCHSPAAAVWSRSVDIPDPLSRVDYDEYDDSVFSSHSSVGGHSSALQSTSCITFDCDQGSVSTHACDSHTARIVCHVTSSGCVLP